jgi:hypothetical protein
LPRDKQTRIDDQIVQLGCSALAWLLVIGLIITVGILFTQQYHAARYPGATSIPVYTNYTVRPFYVYMTNAYRTSDRPTQVHNWYADHLDLKLILDEQECVTLEGVKRQFAVIRTTTVLVCGHDGKQTIYITRSNSFR